MDEPHIQPRPKLISCRVMIDELRPFLPPGIETEVFEISLHTHPNKLRERLQQAIDASDGRYDPICLGYGMCAKATVGLVAQKSRLVAPKADDCIEMFLGSRRARLVELTREPGTYFLTRGYIGDGASMIFSDYEHSVAKFGKEKADKLLRLMMQHYKRLVYIRMPQGESMDGALEGDRAYARQVAERFQMNYVEVEGVVDWIGRLIADDWGDDFVVTTPGQPIETHHFLPAPPAKAAP